MEKNKTKCEFSIGIDLKPNGKREYFMINKNNNVVNKFKNFFQAKNLIEILTNGFVETPLN